MEQDKNIPPIKRRTQNKIIETYAEDMARVIEDDKTGLVKKIIHEEEEREIEKKNLSPESKKNQFFILMSFLLIALGAAIVFYFYQKKEVLTVSPRDQFPPLIFNDRNVFIEVKDFKKEEIAQTVFNKANETKVKKGGVEGVYLTFNKKIIGLREFLARVEASFIPGTNSLLVSDNFLLGVVNNDAKDLFILLKTRSVTDIFDSMRAWEGKMFLELRGFFGLNVTPETKYLPTKSFEDGIVENKNARILYEKGEVEGRKIVMMYIFADDNSIIITPSRIAAKEIMLRLAASKVKK